MDFVMQLPRTARGKMVIMVVVDRLSKQCHLVATRDEATSAKVVKLFVERIYSQHGMPRSIVSDRDSRFTAQFWQVLMGTLRTSLDMSSVRHSESDGQLKRTIQTVEQYLRIFVKYNQKNWDELLTLAEFCYNSAEHEAIGMSPFQVVYGRQPLTPLELMKEIGKGDIPVVDEMLKEWKLTRDKCEEWAKQSGLGNQAETLDEVTQEEE
jgi:Integrase core domain